MDCYDKEIKTTGQAYLLTSNLKQFRERLYIGIDYVVQIGCWWERGVLVDYDGVYSFPKGAGILLKAFGVHIPKDMY